MNRIQLAEFVGRWGNHLGQYAVARSAAERLGATLEVPEWDQGRRVFGLTDPPLGEPLPPLPYEWIPTEPGVAMRGYFQDARSFALLNRAQLRRWLRIRPELLALCPKPRDFYIACHIRRGDNLRDIGLARYAVVEPEVYERAVVAAGFRASDILWVSEEEPQPGSERMPPGLEFLYDFMVLMQADVVFRANSTFSQWAAILGEPGAVYSPRVGDRVGFIRDHVEFEAGNHCAMTSRALHTSGYEDMHLEDGRRRLTYLGAGNMGMAVASAAALSGWDVTIVDINPAKVAEINAGRSPVPEARTAEAIATGRVSARSDLPDDLGDLVAVGVDTPIDQAGRPVYASLRRALGGLPRPRPCPVLVMSTVFPGARDELADVLDPSDVYHPVFLRAGSGVDDYLNPGRIIIGCADWNHGVVVRNLLRRIVPGWSNAFEAVTQWELAEWAKATHNSFLCLKIGFANEWGQRIGPNAAAVMELLREGPRGRLWTMSHMVPGLPFAGPCLPKDARWAWHDGAKHVGASPVIDAIFSSRERHVDQLVHDLLRRAGDGAIGIAGLSFKPDFIEVRESLAAEIVRRIGAADLGGHEPELVLYDPDVVAARDKDGIELVGRGDQCAMDIVKRATADLGRLAACRAVIATRPDMAALEK